MARSIWRDRCCARTAEAGRLVDDFGTPAGVSDEKTKSNEDGPVSRLPHDARGTYPPRRGCCDLPARAGSPAPCQTQQLFLHTGFAELHELLGYQVKILNLQPPLGHAMSQVVNQPVGVSALGRLHGTAVQGRETARLRPPRCGTFVARNPTSESLRSAPPQSAEQCLQVGQGQLPLRSLQSGQGIRCAPPRGT